MWNISDKYLEEIKNAFSSQEEFEEFINCCQIPLKKSIKINLHKILPEDFVKHTQPDWWKLTSSWFIKNSPILEDIFYVDRQDTSVPLWKTFYHQSGFFYIQEIAAWLTARQLFTENSKWNEIILDMSAAPWGKSVQIWDYLQFLNKDWNLWVVVSNDLSKKRLLAMRFNLNRMWIFNSVITNFNGFSFGKNLPEFFDKVLLDAPCSWEWTWFKSDFWLKYWRKNEIKKIASTQYQLLVSALKTVKEWWTIVYSTCTLNPYENEYNIKKLLDQYSDIVELEEVVLEKKDPGLTSWNNEPLLSQEEAEKVARFWSHKQKTGWFFIAKLKKIGKFKKTSEENELINKKTLNFSYDKSLQNKVKDFLNKNYWIITNENKHFFVETNNYVYITSPLVKDILKNLSVEKIWTPILKKNKLWQLRPTHYLGIIFWDICKKNYVTVSKEKAYKYAQYLDLEENEFTLQNIDNPPMNYVIIKYKNWGIGVWKLINGNLKNKYIK